MPEFVEQRTRWSRANIHVFARHNPLRNGLAGPRVWFYMWHRGAQWAQAPLMILAPLFFILALGTTVVRSSAVYLVMIPLVLASFWFGILLATAARYKCWGLVPWFPTYLAFTLPPPDLAHGGIPFAAHPTPVEERGADPRQVRPGDGCHRARK